MAIIKSGAMHNVYSKGRGGFFCFFFVFFNIYIYMNPVVAVAWRGLAHEEEVGAGR